MTRTHSKRLGWPAVLLCITVLAGTRVRAQDAVASIPQEELRTSADRMDPRYEAERPLYASTPSANFQIGPVVLRPRLLYRYLNAEGLPLATRRIASEIKTVSPGLEIDLGNHWSADYSPRWTWYTARALRDTVDHYVSLRGNVSLADWALNVSEDFASASPTLTETAIQTNERTWLTSLQGLRELGSFARLDLSASLAENYTELFPDTRNWSTQDWVMFHATPTLDWGVGAGAGYVEISAGPDMTFERYLARIDWRPTQQLSLTANAGEEHRRSRSATAKELKFPTVNAELSYRPFTMSAVRISYGRRIQSSYFREQVNQATGWTVGVQQRLLGHFYLSSDWSRQRSKYEATSTLTLPTTVGNGNDPTAPILVSLPGRDDRVDTWVTRLTTTILKRISISATYQDGKNRSNQAGFTYTSKQYGFEVTCRY